MKKVVYIPGDGIGPSIVESVISIINASGAEIEWVEAEAGLGAFEKYGNPLPDKTINLIHEHKVTLKGPLTTPIGDGFRSVNVELRREFDLFANYRPIKSFEGVKSKFSNIDLIIFRENTEGLYSGIECYTDDSHNRAESVAVVTRQGSERIIRSAFEYAIQNNRKEITIVHKANILKFTSGMFLEIGRKIALEYPSIKCNDKIIDNMCMQLVIKPEQFDIIVTTNLFGDILSDLASGLIGGLGLAPGANLGKKVAIFEAVHGSAPDITGKNLANPSALLLAGILLLNHIGFKDCADKIKNSLIKVLKDGEYCTKDLNVNGVGTIEMTNAIIRNM
ncbi:MAG: NAD-dependent isocitrate dehydrogenase [Chlorobiota bacterium]|nr:NAD-dependent isocitrate dehydrogenase [Chlorobiota bacterium]QQS65461.1 MAG: NAD-dependent isocitrate dehydrogenase [Chlorobiota bacterium]